MRCGKEIFNYPISKVSICCVCPLWAECGAHADVDSWEQTLSAEAKTLISTWKENPTKEATRLK